MLPKQPEIKEQTALIILEAVALHERQLGITSLARVLKGSRDKRLAERKLYESKFFGAFFYYPVDVIENFIKQLLQQGYLSRVNIAAGMPYAAPVLLLSEQGRKALAEKKDIALEKIRTIKPVVLNDSIQETLAAFKELKSIFATAQKRSLAESTIWKHLTDAVRLGVIEATDIVEHEKIKLILEAELKIKEKGLKALKEALPEDISYEEIRCTLAGFGSG